MINPVRREDILGESGKRLSETLRIRMEAVKIIDGRPSMDALRHRIDGSQLALDTDLIMEGAGNPLSTGRHTTDCGYYDLLPGGRQDGIRWMSIDRIFVHPEMRGSGGSTRMLADLCRAADAAGIGLLGAIAPDRTPGEAREAPRYMKVRNSLEQAMDRLGFKPLEAGGETYPLDRIRHPRQHESCTPIRFMQLLESAPA
jgi:GNAT superfamily N-acetyltransferase